MPCRRCASTARVSNGNAVRMSSRWSSSIRRLCGVSLINSTILSKPESRSLSAHRRSSAWMSRSRASASIGMPSGSSPRTTSHARRSPGSGMGTSVRTGTPTGRTRRRRPISASWPASSAAPLPGIARTSSWRPTAAHARLSCLMVGSPPSPRSIRPNWECEMPTLLAAVRRLAPASSRAVRISRPISNLTRRVTASASRSAPDGRGMAGWWRGAVDCDLPPRIAGRSKHRTKEGRPSVRASIGPPAAPNIGGRAGSDESGGSCSTYGTPDDPPTRNGGGSGPRTP